MKCPNCKAEMVVGILTSHGGGWTAKEPLMAKIGKFGMPRKHSIYGK